MMIVIVGLEVINNEGYDKCHTALIFFGK